MIAELQETYMFLTFRLGQEKFGIGIQYVKEIVGIQPITPIPESPQHVKGVINLRGQVIPVVDMRERFKMKADSYTERTCIIIINLTGACAGLIVDGVSEVAHLSDSEISLPPGEEVGLRCRYIEGVGKTQDGVILLLDCEKFFMDEES